MKAADIVDELILTGSGFVVDLRGDLYRFEPAAEEEPFAAPTWQSLPRSEELRQAIRLEIERRIAAGDGHCIMPSPIVHL